MKIDSSQRTLRGQAGRDRLEAKLEAMRRAQAERWSLADRMAADLAFHEAVCEASGNETLLELWRSLVGRVTIMVVSVGEERMARLQDAAAHEPLVEAIASGDEETIRETYRAVFEEGRRVVASAVAQASADGSAS